MKGNRTKWDSPESIEKELIRIMELENIQHLPDLKMLRKHSTCYNQIQKTYGGLKFFSERMGIPTKQKYNWQKVKRICKVCGKEFEGVRSSNFCSSKCRNTKERICPVCGKKFVGVRKYCSDECMMVAARENGRNSGRKRLENKKEPTVYDGIHQSQAFRKEREMRELGLHFADAQTKETYDDYAEKIDLSVYEGLKTWEERMD